ncbi:MAG: hypothetical protein N2651_06085 [Fimbriimonadales bacterium]|nr:hypothetical protein [Fimbriimonadales bacterium]
MAQETRLPEFLRPLFWDVEFHALSPERYQSYICLRIIEHGDLNALRWMLRYYGKARLRRWLIARQGRSLSPRALRFWQMMLGIPKRTVDQWLQSRPEPSWPPKERSTSK